MNTYSTTEALLFKLLQQITGLTNPIVMSQYTSTTEDLIAAISQAIGGSKTAIVNLSAGSNLITFGVPFPAGTVYAVEAQCSDSEGNVDYMITGQNETSISITTASACTCKFMASIKNDNPIIS
jgi:hypothetical protein